MLRGRGYEKIFPDCYMHIFSRVVRNRRQCIGCCVAVLVALYIRRFISGRICMKSKKLKIFIIALIFISVLTVIYFGTTDWLKTLFAADALSREEMCVGIRDSNPICLMLEKIKPFQFVVLERRQPVFVLRIENPNNFSKQKVEEFKKRKF